MLRAVGEIEGYKLAADCDSNGWPQSGRNRALREMRKGFALHLAGDQLQSGQYVLGRFFRRFLAHFSPEFYQQLARFKCRN